MNTNNKKKSKLLKDKLKGNDVLWLIIAVFAIILSIKTAIYPINSKHVLHVFMSKTHGFLSCHANIAQRVKICYKIKIDYRVLICCFHGVLLRK